jgi:glycosyltransferase involved in cell wall biosynthesis
MASDDVNPILVTRVERGSSSRFDRRRETAMRIGIDAQYLTMESRSGHYSLTLELLKGFRNLKTRERITVFIKHTEHGEDEEARVRSRVGNLGFPIRRDGIPGRPHRLRRYFAAINRVDVFLYLSETRFAPGKRRCNAFVLADVIPLRLPHWVPEGGIRAWTTYYELARNHGHVFLTFSDHASDEIAATLGIARDQLKTVPLATGRQFRPIAEPHAITEQLSRWGLEKGQYLLSVGTLEPRKNHCLILEAYERLRAQRRLPRGCKLVFAGSRGWMYEPILERIDSLGLREEVVIISPADPLEYLYNGALMMIFPSFMEGFGLPPLEAMSCGTPVIASNASSLPEVVGDAGIMIDPHDVDGLTEAIARVLTDPDLREGMRARGVVRAAHFTWERTASAYLKILNEGYSNFLNKTSHTSKI